MSGLPSVSLVDLLDIILVAIIIYSLFRLIRGTRGLYMLMGLLICAVIFWLAKEFELKTLGLILGQFFASLILVVIVIFQHDIRRVLTKVGRSPFFAPEAIQERETLEEIIKTSISLANKKIGALIVIERGGTVVDHVEQGVPIDARVDKDLLTAIFLPVSPLHDGAVVIQGGRIALASCLLPMSMNVDLAKTFGTRHRAAIGLTEETDAVVIVVSEERGTLALSVEGKIEYNLDSNVFRARLYEIFNPPKALKLFRHFISARIKIDRQA